MAIIASIYLAQRPYPADPTQLPTFGTPNEWKHVNSVADSYELFDFLRANAGRKVRLSVGFEMNAFEDSSTEGLTVPGPCAGTDPNCLDGINLKINDVSEQRHGLSFQHGEYVLTGYFADLGSLGVWTGIEVLAITPLTAVEAVN
ncbi:hypothetical protein [Amycolatopsis sp. CA-126428]|uniref:hypothetical protein n=1 Tax=Amycolatopsis sp. CA-126428 TaxID=2073158 RepID=UPI000CD0BBB7|nr:hypothetical protein [Amycolatopsis sp. CA-126428]